MAGVMHVDWYATVLRKDLFELEVSRVAPHRAALRSDPVCGPPLAG